MCKTIKLLKLRQKEQGCSQLDCQMEKVVLVSLFDTQGYQINPFIDLMYVSLFHNKCENNSHTPDSYIFNHVFCQC